MKLSANLRLSLHALARARGRTALSASGMAIGIGSMVVLLGLSSGAERSFRAALEDMGRNLLAVGAERTQSGALRGASRQVETLTLSDAKAIAAEVVGVERVAPITLSLLTARNGKDSRRTTVIGTTSDFALTNNQYLASGRFLDELDDEEQLRVAVIGAEVAKDLYDREEAPLGKRLLIGGMPFTVVGVLVEKGLDPTGSPQDDRILVPLSTLQNRLLKIDYVDRVFVQAESDKVIGVTEQKVRDLLRTRHQLDETQPDDFTIRNQNALLKTISSTDRSLTRLLLGLASLTTGLAGVGLFAVSLLSVRERRSEIGLRLAVGALPLHVSLQFLSETIMTALLGASSGLATGGAVIILCERTIGWQITLSWKALLYPFLVSLVIAVLSGAWPAARASRVDPIVALRAQ